MCRCEEFSCVKLCHITLLRLLVFLGVSLFYPTATSEIYSLSLHVVLRIGGNIHRDLEWILGRGGGGGQYHGHDWVSVVRAGNIL